MGRITKDLEIKMSASNMAILKFTVAVNRRKKGEADFINCLAFDKTAENIQAYFKKGSMIAIEGRIQTGSYENKEGQKVYTTEVIVDAFHFTGEKKIEATETGFTALEATADDEMLF
jgi:single-strand DNA-binding protein